MSEFLVRYETYEIWKEIITTDEFNRVISIREGDSSIGFTIKNIK